MKYALVSAHHFREEIEKPEGELVISGLYQWGHVFEKFGAGGEYLYIPELQGYQIEEYDIVHVNMTQNNQTIISEIRDRIGWNTKTVIVCNVDICSELWQSAYGRLPLGLLREIDKADVLFNVEPKGADILSMSLGRDVPVIPHPVDVEGIRAKHLNYARNGGLAVIQHRYNGGNWLLPYLSTRDLDITRWLFGWTSGDVGDRPDLLYNRVLERVEFDSMMEILSQFSIGMDLFTYSAYGRFPVECGALGIPCITSDRIAAGPLVHPSLVVDPLDARGVRCLVLRLLTDIDFWEKCAQEAFGGAGEYSLERSYEKMTAAVSGGGDVRREERKRSGPPLVLSDPLSAPDWEFDSRFREAPEANKVAGLFGGRWEPPHRLQDRSDGAMKWCLAHGYGSCYLLNGKVFLPPVSDLARHVLAKIPEPLKIEPVLDAGCFQGILALTMAHECGFRNMTGLDASEAAIARAEKNLARMKPHFSEDVQVRFDLGDVEDPPYARESFGVVVCMETLEHVRNPKKAAKKLMALVKAGGRLILTVPDRNLVDSPYHINYFYLREDENREFPLSHRKYELETMLRKIGGSFEVETVGPYLVAVVTKQK